MKKNIKLAAVVLASMLVLAACGKTESVEASVSETSTEASVEASVEASAEEVVEEVVEKEEEVASVEEVEEATASNFEEYLANNEAEYKEMKAQETEELTINVEGNVVVYTYTLPFEVDETTAPTYAAALEDQMVGDAAYAKQLVDGVKLFEQSSGIDGIVLIVSYVDANGVEVYTCKVDANGVVEE